jgi:exopolyphosphatase / guanosine-5'-triphosphate,3'-diphosphate pyrophosphatase
MPCRYYCGCQRGRKDENERLPGCGLARQTLLSCAMETTRRAVIDVGTNSVKLLVADVAGCDIRPTREESRQTRLGQGFYDTHRLRSEAIDATAQAAAVFASTARQCQAASIRIIATSAAREAVNAGELTAAIEQATGVKVEVITGDQEADWGFQGVTTDPQLARTPLLLLDVGGGSTQFTLGQGEHRSFQHSFPVGTVRLLERFPHSDPPKPEELAACRRWVRDFLRKEVRPKVEPEMETGGPGTEDGGQSLLTSAATVFVGEVQLVGVGGTASILGCMEAGLESFDRERLEATRLSASRVTWHLERLWSLGLAERRKIPGLPKNRADVILMGTAIYQAVMEELGFPELRISTRGLRFAAVMDLPPEPGQTRSLA